MRKIYKKTWPDLFQKIQNGDKTFDARIDDFDCQEGNILVLEEYDPKTQKYTGRKIEKKITFVLKTKEVKFWDKKEVAEKGLVIMSLS